MRRIAGLIALLLMLGLTGFSCSHAVRASEPPSAKSPGATAAAASATAKSPGAATSPSASKSAGAAQTTPSANTVSSTTSTKTYTMKVAGLTRTYEVVAPLKALPKSAPVLVVLAGIGAKIPAEITRDEFVPYVSTDKAELVYPVGEGATWNAIGCCGYAWTHRVNDLAFLTALMAKVNPGHARPSYLVGYSNGARLAYRVACTTPSLYNGYAMVKGGPEADCVVRKPTSIIQLASLDDPELAYNPGGKGREPIPVTTEVARLRAAFKCPAKSAVAHPGNMSSLLTWSGCAGGTRVALATWKDGKHSFPRPPASVPAASQVVWSFITKTALAPLP